MGEGKSDEAVIPLRNGIFADLLGIDPDTLGGGGTVIEQNIYGDINSAADVNDLFAALNDIIASGKKGVNMDRNIFKNDGRLKIIKNDRVYVLPDGWELDDVGSYDFSLKLQDRAFAHGSYAVGDGYVKGRSIKVSFDLKRESEKDHDQIVNEAYQAFAQRDYVLHTGRPDRCFKVAGISKLKHKYQKGFKQRWSDIEISLLLADPFRYATASTLRKTVFEELQSGTEISTTAKRL